MHKLLLTGMMTFFYPGTASQIAIGLLIAFASAVFYSHFKPFVEDHDDLVSEVTQCQIFFVLLTALMSFISSDNYVAKGAKAGDKAAANAAVKQIVAMTKLTKVAPLGTKDNPFPGGVSFSSLSGTTGTPGSW